MTKKEQDQPDVDGEARLIDQYGEALDRLMSYAGELHSQVIAMGETILGVVKPLMEENKALRGTLSEDEEVDAE